MGDRRERASVVCVHQGALLTVLLADPKTDEIRHYPPGGLVEDGEQPIIAARRETLEETGYTVFVDDASAFTNEYDFLWAGEVVTCRTHWFKGKLDHAVKPRRVVDAHYNRGVYWLPIAEVATKMSFHASIYDAVTRLLQVI